MGSEMCIRDRQLIFRSSGRAVTSRPASSQYSLLKNAPGNSSFSSRLDAQLYRLSISSSELRPPPHRKHSSTIPNKLSKACNLHGSWPAVILKERTDRQAVVNETLPFPSSKPGEQLLIHRLYNEADGPNAKLISPWRGPYTVRAQLSPVIYRVTKNKSSSASRSGTGDD